MGITFYVTVMAIMNMAVRKCLDLPLAFANALKLNTRSSDVWEDRKGRWGWREEGRKGRKDGSGRMEGERGRRQEGGKEGRKNEGRKEGRNEGNKEGRNGGREEDEDDEDNPKDGSAE